MARTQGINPRIQRHLKLVKILREDGPKTKTEIKELLNLSKSDSVFYEIINRLIDLKEIEQLPDKRYAIFGYKNIEYELRQILKRWIQDAKDSYPEAKVFFYTDAAVLTAASFLHKEYDEDFWKVFKKVANELDIISEEHNVLSNELGGDSLIKYLK